MPPGDLQPKQRLGAYGLARTDDRVLLVRAAASSDVPGTWWLPGGGIQVAESPEQCLAREMLEETDLEVLDLALRDVVSDSVDVVRRGTRLHCTRVLYDVRLVGGNVRAEGAGSTEQAAWVPLDEALSLPLMPFVRQALEGRSLRGRSPASWPGLPSTNARAGRRVKPVAAPARRP